VLPSSIYLVLGGWLVIQGRTEVSTLVVFISGFQKIADPWDQLVNFYRSASNARIAYNVMAETLADAGTPETVMRRADVSERRARSTGAKRRQAKPRARSQARPTSA